MSILLACDFDAADWAAWLPALQAALPGERLLLPQDLAAQPALREDIDVAIVANPPPGQLAGLPRLGLIQSLWAGVDRLLADPTLPAEVPLARMVDPAMNTAMAETALWAVLTALVWMAGQVTYRNAQMLRLRDEVFAARLHLTRQQDRVALARELHDVLSHTIGAITMQAAGARALPPGDPRVTDALGHITATSTSAMQELRSLLGFLSEPPEPADEPSARTGSGDLVAHIGALVDSTRACGLRVSTVGLQAVAALPPAEQHAVLRVVQESLANALRHQGRGCRVGIHFQIDDDSVVTHVVSVGGAGRDAALSGHGCGMGLRGIAERLAELGGDVEADGTAQAFRVRARIPAGRA